MPKGIYKHKKGQGGRSGRSGCKYPMSIETRDKLRAKNIGKHHTALTRNKMSVSKSIIYSDKTKHPRWITDRSKLKKRQKRNDIAYQNWRYEVVARDNFRCRINNLECYGGIQTHHILSWREYVSLHYLISNGITLCQAHHPRKRAEEKRLVPLFQELVSVSI
ncbi:MAG: hypothetical protein KKF08_18990 [Gammaproteobacteria bacterium]|nr:hypothetical protein [Gammaproteobacteria bacterium]